MVKRSTIVRENCLSGVSGRNLRIINRPKLHEPDGRLSTRTECSQGNPISRKSFGVIWCAVQDSDYTPVSKNYRGNWTRYIVLWNPVLSGTAFSQEHARHDQAQGNEAARPRLW